MSRRALNPRPLVGVVAALVLGLVGASYAGGFGPAQGGGGGGSSSPVDLLDGSQHQDTTAGTVARGDLVTGQGATATWARLAKGAAETVLVSDGTDVAWSDPDSFATAGLTAIRGEVSEVNARTAGGDVYWRAKSDVGTLAVYDPNSSTVASITSNWRFVHVAPSVQECRLSLSSSDPVGEATGAATLYLLPYAGDRVALYDGTAWVLWTVPEAGVSVALSGATASKPSDVFIRDNAGTLALELVAWTDATNRATALERQSGVYVKAATSGGRRYLGTVYVDGSNQATDSALIRGVWNESNRVRRASLYQEATNTWDYTTATWRQWNASAGAMIAVMQGRAVDYVSADARLSTTNTGAVNAPCGIGIDSTTVNSGQRGTSYISAANQYIEAVTTYSGLLTGYRAINALEYSAAAGTTSRLGDNGVPGLWQSGMEVVSWQ